MILNTLFAFLGIFVLVFLESLLLALFDFRLLILLLLFFFKKVNWKILFLFFSILFLVLDVTSNLPLGSNILIASVPLGFLILSSILFSVDSGITGFLIRILLFSIYYLLCITIPNLLVVGNLGFLSLEDILFSAMKGLISSLLFVLFEKILMSFRKRGNTSQIRLK